jgi:hypothetical protein
LNTGAAWSAYTASQQFVGFPACDCVFQGQGIYTERLAKYERSAAGREIMGCGVRTWYTRAYVLEISLRNPEVAIGCSQAIAVGATAQSTLDPSSADDEVI